MQAPGVFGLPGSPGASVNGRLVKSARIWRASGLIVALFSLLVANATAATLVDSNSARNVVVLDSVVFVLGLALLGGVIVWWGRRIFSEK